jgi:hypothetical protein
MKSVLVGVAVKQAHGQTKKNKIFAIFFVTRIMENQLNKEK